MTTIHRFKCACGWHTAWRPCAWFAWLEGHLLHNRLTRLSDRGTDHG